MHVYTLRRMIIRRREWSSDRRSDHGLARADAPMVLTRLSHFPYAGEVAHAYRVVHDTPSRQVMNGLRRTPSLSVKAHGATTSWAVGKL